MRENSDFLGGDGAKKERAESTDFLGVFKKIR